MDNSAMSAMWVELTEAFHQELSARILSFIRDDKRQKRWWRRIVRWLGSIRKCHCICGSGGIGFDCERPETPPAIPSTRLPVVVNTTPPTTPPLAQPLALPHVFKNISEV